MADQTDPSGSVPAQGTLFGQGINRLRAPAPCTLPDPDQVRGRLQALLTQARAAKTMPWSERDARMWETVFPNMAKWLPEAEADQLRSAFAEEIDRLSRAA